MRIARLEAIPLALPFRETYRTASGRLAARSTVVLRLHLDSGHYGLGEGVPLSLRGGPTPGQVVTELGICEAALAGTDTTVAGSADPAAIRSWIASLLESCRARRVGPQALCAVDIALHDLAGRLSGMPVWQLLGAATMRGVACNATLDAGDPESTARRAAEQRQAGFLTHKVKVGTGADLERVAAVRGAVGSRARVRIDANGAWDLEHASGMLSGLSTHGIELAEQPCGSVPELAALRSRTTIPIVADESVASVADAEAVQSGGACDAVTIKLAKVGGPLEALRIAAMIPSYLSSALDGPIGIAAAVHTAQALPRGGAVDELAHGLATLDMFASLYAPSDGLFAPVLTPSRLPGLGVELDERAVGELRVQ